MKIIIPPPSLSFTWYKNGDVVNNTNIQSRSDDGAAIIPSAIAADEGYYQCRATNKFGTSVSDLTLLKRAFLSSTGDGRIPTVVEVVVGLPASVYCNSTTSVPKAIRTWNVMKTGGVEMPVTLNKRLQMDDEGSRKQLLIVFVVVVYFTIFDVCLCSACSTFY